jgi:hypothetical protein
MMDSWTQQFNDGRAAIAAAPLTTPLVGRSQHTFARLDRAEATEKYLGDWVLALIERVERLESEVEMLRAAS